EPVDQVGAGVTGTVRRLRSPPAARSERMRPAVWSGTNHVAGTNRWKINAVKNSNAKAKPVQIVWPPATASQSTSTMPATRPATDRPGFGSGAKNAVRTQRAIHKPRIAESK